MPAQLQRNTLSLPSSVIVPAYDVKNVTPAIVHIGLGGFHRAHLARYTHDLMGLEPMALKWGIEGAGLRTADGALLSALAAQDGLYTLVERDGVREVRTLIGSLVATLDASSGSEEVLGAISRATTRIVSITVTERGYHLDGSTKQLDLTDPVISQDIATPRQPRSVPGILVEGLRRRRDADLPAFTALTCDNIQHNGAVVRAAVLKLAEAIEPALAAWIASHGRFPNSMVDRITPVPTQDQIAAFIKETGLYDRAVLFCEGFRQWIIEDNFADGRPAWDLVGAQFVDDVTPYEAMKLRLLNASHLAIAGLGYLCGYETIRKTINDPLVRRYMIRLMDTETGPTLPAVPGIDLASYKATLLERFGNPAIRDTVRRVNADAPVNLLVDPLRDRLAEDAPVPLLALGLAAWCRRVCEEARDTDKNRAMGAAEAELQGLARTPGTKPADLVSVETVFGLTGRDPRFVASLQHWLGLFEEQGVAGTLQLASEQGCF